VKKLKSINSIKKKGNFLESESELTEKAYAFAEKAHCGQSIDLKGRMQFFNHPAYAGYFLAKWKQDSRVVSAGLLHDVIEDCGVKLSEIKSKFGERVAFYVDGMSYFKRKVNGKLIKDYKSYFKKFSEYVKKDPVLAIIKASDEMSKLPPRRVKNVIASLKDKGLWEDYQKMVNERMRGFWIPFFSEIGFGKVVKRIKRRGRFVKEVNIKIILYNYLSKKDLQVIRTKLAKMKCIESLRNS
jgi:(p)ppGpp synthase/HD superfamily hydrolase